MQTHLRSLAIAASLIALSSATALAQMSTAGLAGDTGGVGANRTSTGFDGTLGAPTDHWNDRVAQTAPYQPGTTGYQQPAYNGAYQQQPAYNGGYQQQQQQQQQPATTPGAYSQQQQPAYGGTYSQQQPAYNGTYQPQPGYNAYQQQPAVNNAYQGNPAAYGGGHNVYPPAASAQPGYGSSTYQQPATSGTYQQPYQGNTGYSYGR